MFRHRKFRIGPQTFETPTSCRGWLMQGSKMQECLQFPSLKAVFVVAVVQTKSQEASTLSQRLPEGLAFGKETAGSKIPLLGRLSETKGYMAHATLAASPSVSHERTNKDNVSSAGLWFSEADSGCLTGSDRLHCAQRKLILEQYEYGKAGIGSLYWDTTDGVTTYMNKPLS
ncbi:uncharacterized protein B0T23DRAFT_400360 [Neurospora hispaniola]|uniref:Uncharacterized protein n=1 Tax=Neurospora hispaniola TaxID=588809 RepID=A0AAJ0HXM9_9PEZI|nr:hypothetical protein B0T23DRAFT_400360 [Neurospora hispaniola]